ncbi:MAG: hypothetical protein J6113_02275 [Lachnospiraceae bacterium]|nr:hypothetical protein [Lachnospiraceae bacterium]
MNRIKDKLLEAFRMYFILFTLISVLLMVLGLLFDRDRVLGYEVFISPLLYAAIGVIPVFFFREDKEISMKRLIIRRLISLGFIELTIMVLAFSASSIPTEKLSVVIGIAVGIAVVFVLSGIVEYVLELGEAQNLNKALAEYQNE